MIRSLLTAFTLIASLSLTAQRSAIFFTEFGEKFTLYIDAQKQNDTPSANIKVEELNKDYFQVRIDFEDDNLPDFTANSGAQPGHESTYMIERNRKGKFVVRLNNLTPLSEVAEATPVRTEAPAPTREEVIETEQTISTSGSSTTTTTTTISTDGGSREKVDVKMEVPGMDVSFSMDVPAEERVETQTTTTTTTVTQGEIPRLTRPAEPAPTRPMNGPCDYPATDGDIEQMKAAIENKSFEDSKMTVAKQATKSKCMSAAQVAEIMTVFSFEDSRLEYAKYAYDFTYDKDNYYFVNDSFQFEMTIDELNEYLESK